MAIEWQCVNITRAIDGTETETILPVDQEQIQLHEGEHMLPFSVPYRDRHDYNIRGRDELWFGFRDSVSGEWQQDRELFGGYVRRKTRKREGGELEYMVYVVDYGILFDTTTCRGFPFDPFYIDPFITAPVARQYHFPPQPTDPKVDGYPPGYYVADWIKGVASAHGGDKPFDGLVNYLLQNIDIGAIANAYQNDDAIIDQTVLPTNTAILGYLEHLTLRQAIELILVECLLLQPNVKPHYFFRPKASGTAVKPELVMQDLSVEGDPDWSFSADDDTITAMWTPADTAGTVYSFWDYTLDEDATNLRTRVDVFGTGSDTAPSDSSMLVRVVADNADLVEQFPTKYQKLPGWAGEPIIAPEITTLQGAKKLAAMIQAASRTEKVTVTFSTFAPVKVGDLISMVDSWTDMNGVFPVTGVSGGGVLRQYEVTAGYQQPTVQDILSGPRVRLLELAAMGVWRNTSGVGQNFLSPNNPTPRVPVGSPRASAQNALAAMQDGVLALEPLAPTYITQVTTDRMPIGTASTNYASTPAAEPPLRPVPGTDRFPTPRYVTRDPATGAILEFDMASGWNGPKTYTYGFDSDGWETVLLNSPVIFSSVYIEQEYDSSGEPIAISSGVHVKLRVKTPSMGSMTDVTDVDSDHPIYLKPKSADYDGDACVVWITNTVAGHRYSVGVSEVGISAALLGL